MFAALVPPGVVTSTLAVPAARAGVVQVMVVALTTTLFVAAVPPKVTFVAPVKFVPVSVTIVPPAVGPLFGLRLVSVGGDGGGGLPFRMIIFWLPGKVYSVLTMPRPATVTPGYVEPPDICAPDT